MQGLCPRVFQCEIEMDDALSERHVSSPASTGGAGTFFEQHVDAYWLALLLVRGILPIIHDCAAVEVHLQTEHLGWHTDDFLVVGQSGSGKQRKLAGQVKRTFTVSATDEECKEAIKNFWHDFKNADLFLEDADRFVLVTLRGTNTLLQHFVGLLDCARAARDGAEFEHRLATDGFIAAKSVHYCDQIRTIIGEAEGRNVTAAESWPFLRVLHLLSLDLGTATRQNEAMIKTMLAHTTVESDVIRSADASWNTLLTLVGDGMAEARRFRLGDLPEALRQRHSPLGGADLRVLGSLDDHTALILAGIRSTIGESLHLPRASLVQQVIGGLESKQVVLVSGPAGSGKSAVAKDALTVLSADHFAFGFRAEEFAQPHFDATLQGAQIPTNGRMLGAILGSQERKILLVESVERLLEKSTRDAFTDLLRLAAADTSWRIVLTCRDYSADLVRASLLEYVRIEHSVVMVPRLDDEELAQVEATYPSVAVPLSNPMLRRILRNPYFLDKALQISWSAEGRVPESEREFRELFWKQIVRADDRLAAGMPRRREEVFEKIAVRRARALTAYVACADLDPAVVDSLLHDSLLFPAESGSIFVAPAHDVLEDWAILRWIEKEYVVHDGSFVEIFAAIGTHPAVRRAYRKWLGELVERDPNSADRLFEAAAADEGVPAQFRDDTLVSLLRAPSSPPFLERHSARLLGNKQYLLKRVIHLLRVACVATPSWVPSMTGVGSLLNTPDGPAWAAVLQLVQMHIGEFTAEDGLLLLGLIEDWSRGVNWGTPYPDGAESVAAVAYSLLTRFDNYGSEDQRKRTLRVIAKIPKGDAAQFERLLRGNGERDRVGDDFREIVFAGMEGAQTARDLPDVIVEVAIDNFLSTEKNLSRRGDRQFARSSDHEIVFGLREGRSHNYFPASAYHGPFLSLLRYHPRKGLDFIITVFNHSADWYAHPRVFDHVEPPSEIELRFVDGTSHKQWCSARLWNWHRGTSDGPEILKSMLMALERWLLEFAGAYPRGLDAVLLNILRGSESAAVTAVVASVATAFPHASGEALLVLLQSPTCIQLDRQRLAVESQAPSKISSLMPSLRAEDKIYEAERKEMDEKPHRQSDLESAIANLQLGPLAARVHEILDKHRATMVPVPEQHDGDRAWRLAMHRMDLRQYDAAEAEVPDVPSDEPASRYVKLVPKEPEPDVKALVDTSAARFAAVNARLSLLMWGLQVFEGRESSIHDPAEWRPRLLEARSSDPSHSDNDGLGTREGPGVVAAVCIRDHWQEMSNDQREWSVGFVCSEVGLRADLWDYRERMQVFGMAADRKCASVLPLLLGKSLTEPDISRVQQAFVAALTHAIDEVKWNATWGVANQLWSIDHGLTLRCVNALAVEASLVDDARRAEEKRPYKRRRQVDKIEGEAARTIRERFWKSSAIVAHAYEALDITEWFGSKANERILAILGRAPAEASAIAGFARTAQILVSWWDADKARRESRRERNYETENTFSRLLQSFLMKALPTAAETVLQPILDAIDRHPKEIHGLIQGLIVTEDSQPNTAQFWFIWNLFATKISRAKWIDQIDNEYSIGREIVSAIFLGPWWKQDVRHWKSLDGYAHHVHALFEELHPSSTSLHCYVRFLYHIGERSLPEAFIRVAQRLQLGASRQPIENTDTIFMLEVLLQRQVYGNPLKLKSERTLREAILFLLDTLVENGSSAAFRMRDDFVTPASTI
jgi:hypothetical protein